MLFKCTREMKLQFTSKRGQNGGCNNLENIRARIEFITTISDEDYCYYYSSMIKKSVDSTNKYFRFIHLLKWETSKYFLMKSEIIYIILLNSSLLEYFRSLLDWTDFINEPSEQL